ncbi:MAG: tetratricopeptide repeat protein, partial [Phyllobacteriaceae bacterium]|nr:tetratricopeptide repeat protein [Phyllobacteriaceae bacterium]
MRITRSALQTLIVLLVTYVFCGNTFALPGDAIRASDKCSYSADTVAKDHLDIMAACSEIIASQNSSIWKQSLAQFVIGRVLDAEGQINRAKSHYGESLELDSSNIDALFNLAVLNWKTDDNEIALHQIKQYIDSNFNDADAHHLKALLEEELGDPITARRDFEFSFRLDPQRPRFLYDYVAHLQGNLEWAKALEIARQAIKISPNDADTILQISQSLFHLENYGEALEWLEKIETAGSSQTEVLFLKARTLAAQGQLTESNLIYEEVIKISDEYYNAYYNHALNSFSLLEYDRAFEMIEKFLSYDSSDADVWELAGKIHLKRGNQSKAARAFAKAFEFAGDQESMLGNIYQYYELDGMFEPFHELSRNLMSTFGETGLLLKYEGMVQSELN